MQISTALHSKAQRLVDQDRVTHVKGLRYEVQGDTGTYNVHLSYPEEATGACDCLSVATVCSHLMAAAISYLADPPNVHNIAGDPFVGLT